MRQFTLLKPSRLQKSASLSFGMVSLAAYIATLVLLWHYRSSATMVETILGSFDSLFSTLIFIFLATLLTYRRPENRISWLLALFTLLRMTSYIRYAALISLEKGAQPALLILVGVNLWPWLSGLTYTLLALVFILFPNGKLPTPRWKPVYWLLGAQLLVTFGTILLLSLDVVQYLSEAALRGTAVTLQPLMETGPFSLVLHVRPIPAIGLLVSIIALFALIMVVTGLWSQISRFRRGDPVERQQIKWVIFVMAIWAGLLVALPIGLPFSLLPLFGPLPAIAIALAILRYRLYDIDIIINRTLVYGALSASLAIVYFGSIVLFENLSRGITGTRSPLATVLSTLLIASLFQPLRQRLQDWIDRAFFRRKYDAVKTLEAFAATIRNEVGMSRLSEELLSTVIETIQPAHLSLVIRSSPREIFGPDGL